ncbi:MAG TPA: hypothetical protein VGD01_16045 [Candidatus Elarobacter sp.]
MVALAACSGGGGGGGGGSTPPVTIANTSSPFFLPSKAGNRWVFSTGGAFTDGGRGTISCTCAVNGQVTERMDLTDPSGAYPGSFLFSKSTGGTSTIDTLLGSSSDHGATVSLLTDGAGHYGIPVNDSNAFVGENWANAGGTSRMTGVNGTQSYGSGIIQSINTDTLAATTTSLTWGFARGVRLHVRHIRQPDHDAHVVLDRRDRQSGVRPQSGVGAHGGRDGRLDARDGGVARARALLAHPRRFTRERGLRDGYHVSPVFLPGRTTRCDDRIAPCR